MYWFVLAANNTPTDETQIVKDLGATVAKNYQSLVIYEAAAGCNFTDVEPALHYFEDVLDYGTALGNIFTALQNTPAGVDGYIARMSDVCDFPQPEYDGIGNDEVPWLEL